MRSWKSFILILVAVLALRAVGPAGLVSASAFSAPIWSVISGGGGLSAGPSYVVEGVIGQPLVALSGDASYQVPAGFLGAFGLPFVYVPVAARDYSGGW